MIVEKTETPLRGNLQRCLCFFKKFQEKQAKTSFSGKKSLTVSAVLRQKAGRIMMDSVKKTRRKTRRRIR